ncbi:GerAB/ArcD/ProY family transporter [Anaerosolibacter sp.]|uniref:GerAB/ArcD/ProY family transporter n=1 Tax=Anaerosolibacter sp. TaxID=1872527 RepID=UPI0039F0AFFC
MNNKSINIIQLRAIIICAVVGIGIVTLPRDLANKIGTAYWLAISLGTIIILLAGLIIVKLMSYYPKQDILQISKQIVGKYLASLIIVILIIYFLLVASATTRFTTGLVNIWMLQLTPTKYLILSIIFVVSYLVLKDVEGIARFSTTFLTLCVGAIVLPIILTAGHIKLYYIQPFLHTNLTQVFQGTKASLLSLLGVETLLIFHKFVNETTRIKKVVIYSHIFIGILYIVLLGVTIGYFGVDQIKTFVYPTLTLFRSVDLHLFIFERFELFFLLLWMACAITSIGIYFFCGCYLMKLLLPKFHIGIIVLIAGTICYFTANYPKNIQENLKLLQLAGNLGLIPMLVIPSVLLIVGKVRGKI